MKWVNEVFIVAHAGFNFPSPTDETVCVSEQEFMEWKRSVSTLMKEMLSFGNDAALVDALVENFLFE